MINAIARLVKDVSHWMLRPAEVRQQKLEISLLERAQKIVVRRQGWDFVSAPIVFAHAKLSLSRFGDQRAGARYVH